MTVVRAFIAISLSPEVHVKLGQVSDQLRAQLKNVAVRWVQPANIHLTLKFLGDVSIANLEVFKNLLDGQAAAHTAFEYSVGKLGAFPGLHRPQVIWVGMDAPAELSNLHRAIENETARLGYPAENRPFSPHLTLGRVARHATPADVRRIGEVIGASKVGLLGVSRAEAVHLYKSDLQPSGAVYTRLHSARLRPQPID